MGTYTLSRFYTESAALVFLALSPSPSLAEKRWRMVVPDNLDDLRGKLVVLSAMERKDEEDGHGEQEEQEEEQEEQEEETEKEEEGGF